MVPEPTKQNQSMDRELRGMVNAITSRVSALQKPAGASQQQDDEDELGVRIITLAGTNTGATMRTELDDKPTNLHGILPAADQTDALGTYVNSNFQAVNNSIMLGSNYNTNDPGVHLDISDFFEHHKADKKGKKKDKKDKEAFKSDQQTDLSG